MKQALRWDFEKREFFPTEIPDGSSPFFPFEKDMDKVVNCAECGQPVTFGECYPSRIIRTNNFVFSYIVCPECHKKELEEEEKTNEKEKDD